jgi:hypothetical protein
MARKTETDAAAFTPQELEIMRRAVARINGSIGGRAKVKKGLGSLSPAERLEISKKGTAARWGTANKKAKK